MHYAPRAIDGPFFPRLKFFRTGGHESAPRVQFCAARPGNRRLRVSSRNFSLLYLKERRFLAEKCAMHLGGQNVDQMKRPKRPRSVAQAVLPKGKWMCGPVKHQITSSMGGSSLDTDRSKTVSNPYLSTPDELEGDNMRGRKLKSRLITLNVSWTCIGSDKRRFLRFFIPRKRHRAACQTTLTTLKPNKQNRTTVTNATIF